MVKGAKSAMTFQYQSSAAKGNNRTDVMRWLERAARGYEGVTVNVLTCDTTKVKA